MFKIFSFILIGLVFFPSLVFSQTNLLTNGGFENGELGSLPLSWNITLGPNDSQNPVVISTDCYDGGRCLEWSSTSSTVDQGFVFEQEVDIFDYQNNSFDLTIFSKKEFDEFNVARAQMQVLDSCQYTTNIYNWDTEEFENCPSSGSGCYDYHVETWYPGQSWELPQSPRTWTIKDKTASDALCIRVMALTNLIEIDFWFDEIWLTAQGLDPETPTTTESLAIEDLKIINILLMILVSLAIFDLIRRLFMPNQKK